MWQKMLASSMPWQGRRVRLRFITPDDAWLHVRLSKEVDVRRFLGAPMNQTEAEAREALKRVSPEKDRTCLFLFCQNINTWAMALKS